MYLQYLLSLFALHCWQFPSAQFRTASHTSLRTLNQFATQACFKGPSLPASRHSWLFNCLAKSQRHTERPSLHAPPPPPLLAPKNTTPFCRPLLPLLLSPSSSAPCRSNCSQQKCFINCCTQWRSRGWAAEQQRLGRGATGEPRKTLPVLRLICCLPSRRLRLRLRRRLVGVINMQLCARAKQHCARHTRKKKLLAAFQLSAFYPTPRI